MAIINDKDFEAQLLAGSNATTAGDGSKKLMVEYLHDLFGADDLVKIKNFTARKTGWVYSDRRSVTVEQPNEFTRRVWQGQQKVRVVNPGDIVIVPGWEAYIGLVRFYKQYIAEEFGGKMSVMMNSPQSQAEFVSKAFVGVYDPNEPEHEINVKEEVEKDLEKTEEPEKAEPAKSNAKKDMGLVDEKPKAK
jgi:hypothetical protein